MKKIGTFVYYMTRSDLDVITHSASELLWIVRRVQGRTVPLIYVLYPETHARTLRMGVDVEPDATSVYWPTDMHNQEFSVFRKEAKSMMMRDFDTFHGALKSIGFKMYNEAQLTTPQPIFNGRTPLDMLDAITGLSTMKNFRDQAHQSNVRTRELMAIMPKCDPNDVKMFEELEKSLIYINGEEV